MRVLCTGDLHLGRGSTKIPNPGSREFSCCGVWDRIVQYAIDPDTRVDVLLLSGDLVDRENRLYEGYGALKHGVQTLESNGIRSFAVSGNHDFDVLPRIAHEMDPDAFRLLGAGGKWETVDVDGYPLRLLGWSFPEERVEYSPITELPELPGDDVPIIGMVHADLGRTGGVYAPTALADLQRHRRVAMWLLGHIHLPVILNSPNAPTVLNPGSPQAMDPGETGVHGPWVAVIEPGRPVVPQQIPLSTAVYRSLEVSVDGLDGLQCHDALVEALSAQLQLDARTGCCRVASYRATLTGETDAHSQIQSIVTSVAELPFRSGDLSLHLDRVEIETRPKIDAEALSNGKDALGILSRILLSVEEGTAREKYPGLVDSTLARLRQVHKARSYSQIQKSVTGDDGDRPPDEETALVSLRRECRNLLAALIEQGGAQ